VPGPRVPLTCLGRTVEHFLPYVPIADRVRVGVAMFSYCGELTFGLSADRDVDDLEVLADGIAESWAAVAAAGPKVPSGEDS
jgi:diacylglycerol O-acyltransferase / wax synthase